MATGARLREAVLIFAPHPDDETLGCAGVILRALRSGGQVRVVYLTNGDGFRKAAAVHSGRPVEAVGPADFLALGRVRQEGALEAARILGLEARHLVFLGYPDTGIARTLAASGSDPFTQEFTRKSATYGLLFPDYHSQAHGQPAPYLREALLGDVVAQIRAANPTEIYVTDAADGHTDHQAGFELVRLAADKAAYRGALYTYLVHSSDGRWPLPRGVTPGAPFESQVVEGQRVPAGISWPPDERRPLTSAEAALKHQAIRAFQLEMRLAGPYVESFVKCEEVFWRRHPQAGG